MTITLTRYNQFNEEYLVTVEYTKVANDYKYAVFCAKFSTCRFFRYFSLL